MIDDQSLSELEQEVADRKNVIDETDQEETAATIYNISSYGADLSAEQHVKRMNSGAYVIPDFQRSYVWTPKKASRFVESLLLGLPVPSIFLYKDEKLGKHLVIDGQQRLKTMQSFVKGTLREKKFRLTEVSKEWAGKTYEDLDEISRQKFDDAIIHTIFFKQDQPSDDKSSVHHVFERINTGGMNLTSQEIRVCVSYDNFAKLLKRLNDLSSWRAIYGVISPRMKDQELILRFLALYYNRQDYERPMTDFLNRFMAVNSKLDPSMEREFSSLFERTIELAYQSLGRRAFRPAKALNAAVFDACMVGLANRLSTGAAVDSGAVKSAYEELIVDENFQKLYQKATADTDSVKQRVTQAINTFGSC